MSFLILSGLPVLSTISSTIASTLEACILSASETRTASISIASNLSKWLKTSGWRSKNSWNVWQPFKWIKYNWNILHFQDIIDSLEVLTLKTYQLELDVYQKMYACVMSCCCLCHLHFQLRTHLLHRQSYALRGLWKPSDPETCVMLILVLQEFWNSRCIITIIRKFLKTNSCFDFYLISMKKKYLVALRRLPNKVVQDSSTSIVQHVEGEVHSGEEVSLTLCSFAEAVLFEVIMSWK